MNTERENSLANDYKRQLALLSGGVCLLVALRRRSWPGLIFGAAGTNLLVRGLTGESLLDRLGIDVQKINLLPPGPQPTGLEMKECITVNCSPEEAYQFWRNLENLPYFMFFLESVEVLDNGRSHWVVKGPANLKLAWDAEIVIDQPNELILWQTLPSAPLKHSGQVQFKPAPPGRGTEVTVELRYEPPGGVVGEAFAHLADTLTEQLLREQVRRFKAVVETGEVPTIDAQPSARSD